MQEALDLLRDQPAGWPQWRAGTPGNELHLFLFESTAQMPSGERFGEFTPFCRFMDGAQYVEARADNTGKATIAICRHCIRATLAEIEVT